MRSHLIRIGVAVTAVCTAVSGTTAATATPSSSQPRTGTYVNGVFVSSGAGRNLVVDRQGGEHLLISDASGYTYFTRLPGDPGFTGTTTDYPKQASVALTRTVAGTAIDIVVTTCQGVETFQISDTARAAPPLAPSATAVSTQCNSDTHSEAHYPPAIDGLASLDDGRIELSVETGAGFFIGLPGKPFTADAPSDRDAIVLCGDSAGDRVYAADDVGDNILKLYILSKARGSWRWTTTAPQKLPKGIFSSGNVGIIGLASSHLGVYAAIGSPYIGGVKVRTVYRAPNGVWSKTSPLPGGDGRGNVVLAASPDASSPGVWEANAGSSIEERKSTTGDGWSTPKEIANTSGAEFGALSVDWQGRPVLEYYLS